MKIRRANQNDAMGIKKVHVDTYKTSYKVFLPDDFLDDMVIDDDVIERTKKYILENECYVVEENGIIVAFAYLSEEDSDVFEVNALYVHPCYQRKQIGYLLINKICRIKKSVGYNKCVVWTLKFGPSIGFYKKIGFVQVEGEAKFWKLDLPIIKFEKLI